MKYKRDYKITVSADTNDQVLWTATHKGEPLPYEPSAEDYEVIAAMLRGIVRRIELHLNQLKLRKRQL